MEAWYAQQVAQGLMTPEAAFEAMQKGKDGGDGYRPGGSTADAIFTNWMFAKLGVDSFEEMTPEQLDTFNETWAAFKTTQRQQMNPIEMLRMIDRLDLDLDEIDEYFGPGTSKALKEDIRTHTHDGGNDGFAAVGRTSDRVLRRKPRTHSPGTFFVVAFFVGSDFRN